MKNKEFRIFVTFEIIINIIALLIINFISYIIKDFIWWKMTCCIVATLIIYMAAGAINIVVYIKNKSLTSYQKKQLTAPSLQEGEL